MVLSVELFERFAKKGHDCNLRAKSRPYNDHTLGHALLLANLHVVPPNSFFIVMPLSTSLIATSEVVPFTYQCSALKKVYKNK